MTLEIETAQSATKDQYIFDAKEERERERAKLYNLSNKETDTLLGEIGLQRGMHCADFGCGVGSVLPLLSARVNPEGLVVGIDNNEGQLGVAQRMVESGGLRNVELVKAHVYDTDLPEGAFDLSYCRMLLQHVNEPEKVVQEMIRVTKPRGVICFEEIDQSTWVWHPPSSAFEKWQAAFQALYQKTGKQPFLGRQLHQLAREAGLESIQMRSYIKAHTDGPVKKMSLFLLENVTPGLLAMRILQPSEIDALATDLKEYIEDPTTVLVDPMFFQVWGKKPQR